MTSTRSQPGSGSRSDRPASTRPRGGVQGSRSLDLRAVARAVDESGYKLVDGVASFEDAHTVRVGERHLSADRILVATGSRTAVPPIEGLEEVDWLDHVSALELTELPETPWSSAAARSGSSSRRRSRASAKVTIVEGIDRIAFRDDEEAAAELAAALRDEGIEIVTGAFVDRVRRDPGALVATVRAGDPCRPGLLAAGRTPNVEELNLERAESSARRRASRSTVTCTSAEGAWAAGDVTGLYQFTPIAQYQARVAVADMTTDGAPDADYSIPTAIFTDPEPRRSREDRARSARRGSRRGGRHAPGVGSDARSTDSKRGLYKVVFERASHRVVGIHVVNRAASEIVQALAVAMNMGATVDDLARVHHTYPSLGEGVKAAAEKALA